MTVADVLGLIVGAVCAVVIVAGALAGKAFLAARRIHAEKDTKKEIDT